MVSGNPLWHEKQKFTEILPSFHSQADLIVSWVGRHLFGPHCPEEANPLCLGPLPFKTYRVGLHIWTLSMNGWG